MIYKNLYIIGNGFDQHHDIQCSFLNFMEWIKENDAGLFFKLTQVYNSAWEYNWWRDFENSLAQLNINYYANKKGNLYDPEYIKDGSIEEKTEYASQKVMDYIFNEIITDLIQFDFFSEYKFRKRDSSLILKTKEGKQIIELDHWIDVAKTSIVIYPIYGVRFDVLSKWFEKFSVKNIQFRHLYSRIKQIGREVLLVIVGQTLLNPYII